jgi:hypothetical protein
MLVVVLELIKLRISWLLLLLVLIVVVGLVWESTVMIIDKRIWLKYLKKVEKIKR